jgi:Uma2 family endonuclease
MPKTVARPRRQRRSTTRPPATPLAHVVSLADLLHHLGDIPPHRILLHPLPGTATERDVIAINGRKESLFELVDGTLVEKAMATKESLVAAVLIQFLFNHVERLDLGIVLGEAGMMRLRPGLVRIPDVSFISWSRLPGKELPDEPVASVVPDLAVEVLSDSNTPAEIARKLDEYFATGVSLAWIVDPKSRTIDVYTSRTEVRHLKNGHSLDGGDVVPGFKLPLKQFFARMNRKR